MRPAYEGGAAALAAVALLALTGAVPATAAVFDGSEVPKPLADAATDSNSNDLAIPDTGTISRSVNIATGGDVGGVEPFSINIEHTFPADLDVFLRSPQNTDVELFTDICGGADWNPGDTSFRLRQDPALPLIGTTCPPGFGTYRPEGNLNDFVGEQAGGAWTLRITDDQAFDTGTFRNFGLLVQPTTRSTLSISGGPNVRSLAVRNLRIEHPFPTNSRLALRSPQGTIVPLYGAGTCPGQWTNDNTGFSLESDPARPEIGETCPPGTGTYRPAGNLNDFVGEPSNGNWQLLFTDLTPGGGIATLHDWSLELADPPETTITARPHSRTRNRNARFEFTTDVPGSTFQCAHDGGFAACTSPFTLENLGVGTQSFQVRAVDSVGNPDASPATASWQVLPRKRVRFNARARFASAGKRRHRVRKLTVTRVSPGVKQIQVRCKGKGCAFKRKSAKVVGKGKKRRAVLGKGKQRTGNLKRLFRNRPLGPKATIQVRGKRRNQIGKVTIFPIRKGKVRPPKQLCMAPGSNKPRRCDRVD